MHWPVEVKFKELVDVTAGPPEIIYLNRFMGIAPPSGGWFGNPSKT
jgi:hypothetical protein